MGEPKSEYVMGVPLDWEGDQAEIPCSLYFEYEAKDGDRVSKRVGTIYGRYYALRAQNCMSALAGVPHPERVGELLEAVAAWVQSDEHDLGAARWENDQERLRVAYRRVMEEAPDEQD